MRWSLLVAPSMLGLALGLVPLACTGTTYMVDFHDQDAGADSGEDADTDSGEDAGVDCVGQCLPKGRIGWQETPVLLWIGGSESEAPPCPEQSAEVYTGRADLSASNLCPTCACGDPSCVLPVGVVSSTLSTCPNDGPGATLTPFDAPAAWDGSCVAAPSPIPSNLLASISIQPSTVTPCTPQIVDPVPKAKGDPVTWGTFARACRGELAGTCGGDEACTPSTPPGGFRACIAYSGSDPDPTCPTGRYSERFTFYNGIQNDTRDCTPCNCDPPAGAKCSALVSVYEDAACGSVQLHSATVTLANGVCHNIVPGMTLSGMAAQWVTNEPGSCAPSGGEPIGTVEPAEPTVFCCEPPP